MHRKWELLLLAALIVFSAGCMLSTIGGTNLILQSDSLPAYMYSNILAGILIIACTYRLIILLLKPGQAGEAKPKAFVSLKAFQICACSILYVLGIRYIGFYISTFFCFAFVYNSFEQWDKSKIKFSVIFSLGLCGISFVLFRFLKIYLPNALFF